MASGSRKEKDCEADGFDLHDRHLHDDSEEETLDTGRSGSSLPSDEARRGRGVSLGLREGIRDVLQDGRDGDPVMEETVENGIVRWLRALDLQVLGACRADERLKPILKLNVSSGVAEDRLMAQLSQHFEVSEVGMLARCLCVPLVSIRVGKVIKQGKLLCPTAIRGHLNLTLLPSSDMRLWFTGDDGCNERLAVVGRNYESSEIVLEEIPADSSGRSFLLNLLNDRVAYFWCSESSRLLGMELLGKMRDLLRKMPSLSQLTGICEERLNSFATHLRAYLLGSANFSDSSTVPSSPTFSSTASSSHESNTNFQTPNKITRPPGFRHTTGSQPGKEDSLYQATRSSISNTQDGLPRNLASPKCWASKKLRDGGFSSSTMNNSSTTTSASFEARALSANQTNDNRDQEDRGQHQIAPIRLPELPCQSPQSSPLPFHLLSSQVSSLSSSLFSPYHCWCQCPSSLQYTVTAPHLPSAPSELKPLPPLSTLLSDRLSPVSFVSTPSLDLAQLSTLDLPAILQEPLLRFPTPVSSFVTMPSSQQIPTFTPFMSDSIVHIPVIDVCSSGQGYLVSAGPSISSAIPPLIPNLVKPLMPESESAVEKNAREMPRMLIASAPTSSHIINMGSAVLTSIDENFSYVQAKKRGVAVAGSRGIYGVQDLDAVVANVICSQPAVQDDLQELPIRSETTDGGCADEDV